jgi:hypothetical protein
MTPMTNGLDTTVGPKGRSPESLLGLSHRHYTAAFTADGGTDEFALPVTVLRLENVAVYVNGSRKRVAERGTAYDYQVRGLTAGYEGDSNRVRLTAMPGAGQYVLIDLIGG